MSTINERKGILIAELIQEVEDGHTDRADEIISELNDLGIRFEPTCPKEGCKMGPGPVTVKFEITGKPPFVG